MTADASVESAFHEDVDDRIANGMIAACRLARAVLSVPLAAIHVRRYDRLFLDTEPSLDARRDAIQAALRRHLHFSGLPEAGKEEWQALDGETTGLSDLAFCRLHPVTSRSPGDLGLLICADGSKTALSASTRGALADLSQLIAAQIAMQAAVTDAERKEAQYRLLAENSTDTIVRGDLDGIRLYISPAVRTLLGYEPEELIGRKAAEIVHPDDAEPFRNLMQKVRHGLIDRGNHELRQRHKDGSWVWMEASIQLTRDAVTGAPDGYVVSARDVGRRKEIELRLEYMASHDPLTDLPNRALLYMRLNREIALMRSTSSRFAVFCMDVDRFKQINDRLGHTAGDEVLRTVAKRLRHAVRDDDMIGRLGGDEFVLIQRLGRDASLSRPTAEHLAGRLIEAMSEPIEIDGVRLNIGLSIGITLATADASDPDHLISAADQALYKAKQAGRNRFVLHRPNPGDEAPFTPSS